jgi:IclR family transcriptional regulator, mhp operon transcriptional activator
MSRPRVKTIRAGTRAAEVLQIVQAFGGVSLNDIHRELGLPKATLLRPCWL